MTPMTRRRAQTLFSNVKTEGGILPQEILERVVLGDKDLPGLDNESYHLAKHERIGEAINRSWSRLQGLWSGFQEAVEKLPEEDLAIALTRDRWLLPLFQELGYGRLPKKSAMEVDKKAYAISHAWHRSPIHLMGCRVTIDKRMKGVAGAAMASPHGLVQDFLNRSNDHLWGFVSNGFTLRALRDNYSLTRQAYVEFDLQAIMTGEQFSEFRLLWLICHQSRVESEKPEDCWLEKWFKLSRDEGIRALDKLRNGVANAISNLGAGFLKHRSNKKLRDALSNGKLDAQEYYRQLLRLVYRLIFLFVAEDRDALLDSNAPEEAKQRYLRFYTTRRLRTLSSIHRGGSHKDLWQGLRLVMGKLDDGCQDLGLPALGSFLWSKEAIPFLEESEITNEHLMSAIRSLCYITDKKQVYPVNWRNIGSEELGSIYESLLELHPKLNKEAGTFELATAAGHERKTTGSYYTPSSLVDCLLDSALEPVLDEAAKKQDPEAAILDLKVCDPACGSGHFLVAAARRIAKRLAAIRAGEDEPSPESVQTAIRDVVGRCVYGVDINPMAVELCKVALWMEALDPGKPLSFLDHRIQCGNSLLGAVPALLEKGIPNEAFKPIEGDDKKFCSKWRKRNKKERENKQETLFDATDEPWDKLGNIASSLTQILDVDDNTIDGVRKRQELYEQMVKSSGYLYGRLWADAWCTSFVWKKTKSDDLPYPITEDVFQKIEQNPHSIPVWMRDEIIRLANQYKFFHWHLSFPDVFTIPPKDPENALTGWSEGFDVVLGNPPWERVKLQEKEWFAERQPEIANAPNAATRKRLLNGLKATEPKLYQRFLDDSRKAEGKSHILRDSNLYPLCGRGDINLYAVFAEGMRNLLSPTGRTGCLLPTGIATDDTTKLFFQDVVGTNSLVSLFDFENRLGLFPAVDSRMKFCLFTSGRCAPTMSGAAEFVFYAHTAEDLRDPDRRFTLNADDISIVNPNSRTCPIFRVRRDAELAKAIYHRVPTLLREDITDGNPWEVNLSTMFHMTNDASLFRTRESLEAEGFQLYGNLLRRNDETWFPVIEGKMIGAYDHRAASIEIHANNVLRQQQPKLTSASEHEDPTFSNLPYLWGPERDGRARTPNGWNHDWFLAIKRVTAATNERTIIGCFIPWTTASYTLYLITCAQRYHVKLPCLCANFLSLICDFLVRQKTTQPSLPMGVIHETALLPPSAYSEDCRWFSGQSIQDWLLPRVLELTYTSYDLRMFANDFGCFSPPFRWEEKRRFLMKCELDAAFFHLYHLGRDDAAYVLGTFPTLKRRDEVRFGYCRTAKAILSIYDAIKDAMQTNQSYETVLSPTPAHPSLCHPNNPPAR